MNVNHDTEQCVFSMDVDGHPATLSYRVLDNETLEYYSTQVSDELRGRGVGGRLARHALDYANDNGYKVVPTCWFVSKFLDRHKDYDHLRVDRGGEQRSTQD